MRKLIILLPILILAYFGYGQGITVTNTPTGTILNKGGTVIDSNQVIPYRDTSFTVTYPVSLRKAGAIVIKSSNQLPYIYSNGRWLNIITGDSTTLFGIYLVKANNLSDLTNAATARTNLGVPSLTGTGASGTWNISILGNAATVTTNANLTGMVTSVGNATTVVTNANLTGDVTSVGNATTLATVATGATVGSSTSIPTFTFNNKGLVTSASGNVVVAPAGTLTGTTLAANVVLSSLTSVGTLANLTVTNPIVGSVTGSSGSTTGNAATATALQTPRTIGTITGDASSAGSSFDGTANNTNALTLATVNGNVGTFGSATKSPTFTVNGKGLITAASDQTVTPAIGSITGFGTGIATALAINVGSAGAPILFNGAAGTPSSLVGTNITGTASGLTAGNVTTNANLTGVITSVGNATSTGAQTGTGNTFVMSASPTITGTLTFPTPFTLGATSVTSTGTQLNYLNAATGTTGTTTTNLVYSTSPTLTTPVLGVAAATSLNTGTTLNGTIFAKSTNALTLASSNHALTVGNESSGVNGAIGLYSTGIGIQGRNNGAIAATNINPLGGDVRFGIDAPAGAMQVLGYHTGGGTGDFIEIAGRNGGAAVADGTFLRTLGTAFTTSGMNVQDGGLLATGTNLSGGLSIGTQASATLRFYTNNTLRTTVDANGYTLHTNRVEFSQATVASANNLTLTTANEYLISGTTQITAITNTDWQAGATISLQFQGSLVVKNNTAGGAGTAVIRLSGAVDFNATALDILTLKYDGTQWVEKSRSIN